MRFPTSITHSSHRLAGMRSLNCHCDPANSFPSHGAEFFRLLLQVFLVQLKICSPLKYASIITASTNQVFIIKRKSNTCHMRSMARINFLRQSSIIVVIAAFVVINCKTGIFESIDLPEIIACGNQPTSMRSTNFVYISAIRSCWPDSSHSLSTYASVSMPSGGSCTGTKTLFSVNSAPC